MTKISLDKFTRYTAAELDALCEFNPDMEIITGECENTKYITVKNILKRPDDLREFISKFPCEDRNLSIEDNGRTHISSKAPGFQQPIEKIYMMELSKNLYELGISNKLFKYKQEDLEFEYYTNCCFPGMKSYNRNYLPHVDPFSIAANIYLTDVPDTGTSFFKFVGKDNKSFYSVSDLLRDRERGAQVYEDNINKYKIESGWSDWVKFTGDDFYQRYHYIPAEYNSCSMYRGNRWHGITYDATCDDVRYSIVGVIK